MENETKEDMEEEVEEEMEEEVEYFSGLLKS